jgi:Tol biopolymer transport system component
VSAPALFVGLLVALALPGVAQAHHDPAVVFESNRDGNLEIYRMNADGSAPTRLTNNPATDTTTTSTSRASTAAGLTQLTSDPRFDLQPAWSPDGTKIAFHSNRTEHFEIYAMNADGTAHQKE